MEGIILKGTVIVKEETKLVGANEFRKRLLVVKTPGEHSQEIPVDFVQDKVALLDSIEVGQEVAVSINLRGSQSNGRYFPGIQGWKIE